jgi:hypothetical protein
MIVVKIMGGLGNQLFQYAMGLSLATRKNTPLKLDLRTINRQPLRKFQLPFFNIPFEVASEDEIAKIAIKNPQSVFEKGFVLFQGRLPYYMHRVVNEQSHRFDPRLFNSPKDCYLIGYFQCEKYFLNVRSTILEQFTLRDTTNSYVKDMCQEMSGVDSVSLHIRRGDYATVAHTSERFGTLSLDYYDRAIKHIAGKVATPTFYVFSDDLDWAKQNLKIPYPVKFVEHTNAPDNVEIIMMSQCKHHIIANSSFSWWGAWLGTFAQKNVVAPLVWYKDRSVHTSDICPADWVRL